MHSLVNDLEVAATSMVRAARACRDKADEDRAALLQAAEQQRAAMLLKATQECERMKQQAAEECARRRAELAREVEVMSQVHAVQDSA